MPKVWLTNLDELVPRDDMLYESMYVPEMVMKNQIRYLICLEPGDMFIAPTEVSDGYVEYISRVNNLPADRKWLIHLEKLSKPYGMVDSILLNEPVMERLRELGKTGGWVLEPYIETPRIEELSRLTGIPTGRTPSHLVNGGLVRQLNHKGFFLELSRKMGVETIPGHYVETMRDLAGAIMKISLESRDRVIIKKAEYAGGAGNLSGGAVKLINALPSWYNTGGVLVEHRLTLADTAGSLVNITDETCEFIGTDVQIIEQGKWAGFRYPIETSSIADEIQETSLRYAEEIRNRGARGYLNMDWAIVERDGARKLFPIEINFRHNGLSCMLDLVTRYFNTGHENLYIYYYGHFILFYEKMIFSQFLMMLGQMRLDGEPILIDRPGMQRGIIAVTPFIGHEIGLVLVGDTEEYVNRLKSLLNEFQ